MQTLAVTKVVMSGNTPVIAGAEETRQSLSTAICPTRLIAFL
jgi:hypothetical protein